MSGTFRIFQTVTLKNAREGSVGRAMVCDVHVCFYKVFHFYKKVLCTYTEYPSRPLFLYSTYELIQIS